MRSKIGLNLTSNYSINFSLPKRHKKSIKFIIIHYTGMKSEVGAIQRLCDYKSKVSSHYFIKNNGQVLNMVPDLFEAWHAGKSYWKKNKYLNKSSIGIEINNPGHDHKYNDFSFKQISALVALLRNLIKKYNIEENHPIRKSVNYKQAISLIKEEYDEEEFFDRALFATRQLAKRQITWMRSWNNLDVFDNKSTSNIKESIKSLTSYL